MVLITIVDGVYKPTYNWGAPHCIDHPLGEVGNTMRILNQGEVNTDHTTVNGCEILHQLIDGLSHYFGWVSTIQGDAGFLPSTL